MMEAAILAAERPADASIEILAGVLKEILVGAAAGCGVPLVRDGYSLAGGEARRSVSEAIRTRATSSSGAAGCGVPLGVNVESVSIFREEIDAAHNLFRILQVGGRQRRSAGRGRGYAQVHGCMRSGRRSACAQAVWLCAVSTRKCLRAVWLCAACVCAVGLQEDVYLSTTECMLQYDVCARCVPSYVCVQHACGGRSFVRA